MAAMIRKIRRGLSIFLVLLGIVVSFAEAEVSSMKLSEDGLMVYNLICECIDQGDAKSAVNVLLENSSTEEVYTYLNIEDPTLLKSILVEAACFYNEDGELFNIVDLRCRGFFSDDMFLQYWERVGNENLIAIEDNEKKSYDEYLFNELQYWYKRGNEASLDIIDLRYLGMIDDALYIALVEKWNVDLMDSVDLENYVPLYGMRLSGDEKEQIRKWNVHVDEGESQDAVEMALNGDITDNVYRWLQKNDAKLVDMIFSQAMFENAVDGVVERNVQLILSGFISDACIERYWSLLEFIPRGNKRNSEKYQDVDMFFVYEMERICTQMDDGSSFLKQLWNDGLIDEYTFDMLIGLIGGWESGNLEMQNG